MSGVGGGASIWIKAVVSGIVVAALWKALFASGAIGALLAGFAGGAAVYAFFGRVAAATPEPAEPASTPSQKQRPAPGPESKAPPPEDLIKRSMPAPGTDEPGGEGGDEPASRKPGDGG